MPVQSFAVSSVSEKTALYLGKDHRKLSAMLEAQKSAFSLTDRFLLFKSLEAQGKHTKASQVLRAFSKGLQKKLEIVYLFEKTDLLENNNDTKGLLALLSGLPEQPLPTFLTRHLIIAIGKSHRKKPVSPRDRRYFERAFDRFDFAKKSSTLLRLYLELLPEHDSKASWALLQLYQISDIGKLPVSLKKRFRFIAESPSRYSKEIAQHFERQRRFRNYTYIRAVVPGLLPKLKYVDHGAFESLRAVYFASYIRARRYSDALKDLNNSRKMKGFDYLDAEKWELQFTLYLKLGNLNRALKILGQFEESQYNRELNKARFQLGKAYFNQGEWIHSFELLRKVDGNGFAEKDQVRLQWNLFMVNIRVGHFVNMQKIADWAADKEFKDKRAAARFCYWGYKLGLYRTGTYLNCYQKFPTTFYGLRSKIVSQPYGAFNRGGSDLVFKFNRRTLEKSETEYLEMVDLLYTIGESRLADTLIELEKTGKPDLTFFDQLRKVLSKHQRYYVAYNLVQAHYDDLIKKDFYGPHFIMLLNYPLAFKGEVVKYAKAAKVDPALVFGVMREESRYRDYVRSGAGAIGLLQLMPKTARFVGRLHKKRIKKSQLVQSKVNLQLGSWYLQRLSKRYDGELAHVLAAYNGGATHVKRWRKNIKEGDPDYFVELITFPETRKYVKRVLKSYYLYQNLYGPL